MDCAISRTIGGRRQILLLAGGEKVGERLQFHWRSPTPTPPNESTDSCRLTALQVSSAPVHGSARLFEAYQHPDLLALRYSEVFNGACRTTLPCDFPIASSSTPHAPLEGASGSLNWFQYYSALRDRSANRTRSGPGHRRGVTWEPGLSLHRTWRRRRPLQISNFAMPTHIC